jgi:hypothetical protein
MALNGERRLRANGFAQGGGIMASVQKPAPQQAAGTAPVQIQQTGLIPVPSSGRADTVTAAIPAESFIVPADIVSALGDGNTEAGARVMDGVVGKQAQSARPAGAGAQAQPVPIPGRKDGGKAPPPQDPGKMVMIRISGGEYAILPNDVARVGGGDISHGHKVLAEFIKKVRTNYAKKIKSLPGPRK